MAIPEDKNSKQDESKEPEKTHVEIEPVEISGELAFEFFEKSVEQALVIDALKQKIRQVEREFRYFLSQSQSEKKLVELEKFVAKRRLSDMNSELEILQGWFLRFL